MPSHDKPALPLPYFIGGAVLLFAILGGYLLKFGHLDGLSLGLGFFACTVVELFGIMKLVRQPRSPEFLLRQAARQSRKNRSVTEGQNGMSIHLCRTSLERLGPGMEPLLSALRERGHSPVVRECLNRCTDCKQGLLMATADGFPLSSKDSEKLLSDLDELSADDG